MGVGESKVTHRVTIFTGDKKGAGANNLIVCIFIFISISMFVSMSIESNGEVKWSEVYKIMN